MPLITLSSKMNADDAVRQIHRYASRVILAFIAVWPPIHIVLARHYHFSTWRYGGLGMYATPDGHDRDVYVFMPLCSEKRAMSAARSELDGRRLGFYYGVRHGRADLLASPDMQSNEQRDLAQIVRDIRSLARPSDFERLGRWVDARFAAENSRDGNLAILVSMPHIDTKKKVAYAETFGFVRERDHWVPLPVMPAERALDDVVRRLGACP